MAGSVGQTAQSCGGTHQSLTHGGRRSSLLHRWFWKFKYDPVLKPQRTLSLANNKLRLVVDWVNGVLYSEQR